MLPPSVRLVAACAPGKRVAVIVAGARFELPWALQEPAACGADPVQILAAQLAERDEQARAAAQASEERMREGMLVVADLARRAIEMQERVVETLMLPVVPTGYDKTGRIISAQRKKD